MARGFAYLVAIIRPGTEPARVLAWRARPTRLDIVALPCRVGDPDRKGKVESGIGHTQKTPLQGLRFETLDAAQAYLDRWETRWADTRIHGTPSARWR